MADGMNANASVVYLLLVFNGVVTGFVDLDETYYGPNLQWARPLTYATHGKHQVGVHGGDLVLAVFVPVHARNPDAIYGKYS